MARKAQGLSHRERQVASMVATGMSNRDIGAALGIGHRTVETHVQKIFKKLRFRSRVQIGVWATANHLRQQTPHRRP